MESKITKRILCFALSFLMIFTAFNLAMVLPDELVEIPLTAFAADETIDERIRTTGQTVSVRDDSYAEFFTAEGTSLQNLINSDGQRVLFHYKGGTRPTEGLWTYLSINLPISYNVVAIKYKPSTDGGACATRAPKTIEVHSVLNGAYKGLMANQTNLSQSETEQTITCNARECTQVFLNILAYENDFMGLQYLYVVARKPRVSVGGANKQGSGCALTTAYKPGASGADTPRDGAHDNNDRNTSPTYCYYGDKVVKTAVADGGFTFQDWNNTSSTTNPFTISNITADSAVDYRFKGNTYNIGVDSNGGSGGSVSPTTYTTSMSSQTATLTQPTRGGYTFDGWEFKNQTSGYNSSISGNTINISAGAYANFEVRAKWKANQYKVSVIPNGGSTVDPVYYYTSTSTQKITVNRPTAPADQYFSHWDHNGVGEYHVSGDGEDTYTIPANAYGDISFKANWAKYDANAPTISSATGSNVTYGYSSATVSVSATAGDGTPISGYQWYTCNSDGTGASLVSGATSATYSVPTGKDAGTYYYKCVVTGTRVNGNTASTTSSVVAVSVAKADQSAPTVTGNAESAKGKADGTMTGLTTNMEYSTDGTNFTSVSNTSMTFAAGTYYVRVKGDGNHNPSSNTTVVISAGPQLTLTVQANNSNYGTVTGSGSYDYNAQATITATANTGYHFVKWSDNNTNATRNVSVTVSATYTAEFAPDVYTITVTSDNATMGSVSGGGSYEYGSSQTISATPNTGYHFVQWNDGDTNATRSITVNAAATYTAYFAANNYTVTANVNDSTMGSVTGGGTYAYLTPITLTATANTGYHFVKWNDDSTNSTKSFTLTDNVTYTATFAPDEYTVTVNVNDAAMGTVSGAGTYTYLSSVTITATANDGYHFVQWNDGDENASRDVTVTDNVTYTATFAPNTYAITTAVTPDGSGSVTGAGTYDYNSQQTLMATANAGYEFVQWSDGDTDNPRSITVTEEATYTAVFQAITYTVTLNTNDGVIAEGKNVTSYTYGVGATLPSASDITKEGFTFKGWFTDSEFSGDAVTAIGTTETGDKEFFAKWVDTEKDNFEKWVQEQKDSVINIAKKDNSTAANTERDNIKNDIDAIAADDTKTYDERKTAINERMQRAWEELGMLDTYFQLPNGASSSSENIAIRFFTTLTTGDNFYEAGFEVTMNGKSHTFTFYECYAQIQGTDTMGEDGQVISLVASDYNPASNYFVTFILKNIPQSAFNAEITIRAYAVKYNTDRDKVYGISKTTTVNELLGVTE